MTEADWLAATAPMVMLAFAAGRDVPPEAVAPKTLMSERQLRLFLVGCCRRQWRLIVHPELRAAVEVAERFADGNATAQEMAVADSAVDQVRDRFMQQMLQVTDAASRSEAMMDFHLGVAISRTCSPMAELVRRYAVLGGRLDIVPLDPKKRPIHAEAVPQNLADAVVKRILSSQEDETARVCALRTPEFAAQATLLRDIFGNPFRSIAFDPSWRSETVVALAAGIYADRAFDRMPILADALEEAGCDDADVLAHCRGPGPHVRGCWVVDRVLGKE